MFLRLSCINRLWFALLLCCLNGCGGAVAGVREPAPDLELAQKIRDSSGASDATETPGESEAPAAAAATWGNLTGKFVYDGPDPSPARLAITKDEQVCGKHNLVDESLLTGTDKGLKNVVIFLADKNAPVHPDFEATANAKVKFDNEHCRFEPHILPLRTSQTLEIHNSDALAHNSNLTPLGDSPFNQLISQDKAVVYKFKKQQNSPVTVTCSIHPWMKGYVFPRDNPYVAVTGEDGGFELKNLPAGKHDFQVWQESVGGLAAKPEWKKGKFKLEINEGDNDLGTVQVSSALFGK